ncbi:exosome non-catalytic core subunit rrp4 [Borealophlyctis nickersoniae]|nr:exosome non-catalytic core subunit rrp4 [Borealophlyctis nickersoniae]
MSVKVLLPSRGRAGEDDMETDEREIHIVTPGEVLTSDPQFMRTDALKDVVIRGHGTYPVGASLAACAAGVVERVNMLLSVRPLRSRYHGEIGDVVIGRVSELGPKRWKVDINARQDAILLLSSINLPGGVQRRKNESDELQMRTFFAEGDLVCAEVQTFFQDGAASLHTRSIKYGKLRNGSLVIVPSALVKRSKSHFATLPSGVDIILGLNGYIWVSKHVNLTPEMALQPEGFYSNDNESISNSEREVIARVCNCITALGRTNTFITDSMIVYTFEASTQFSVKELLNADVQQQIVLEARAQRAAVTQK